MAEHTGCSGTDLAPILGVSPFGSKLSVYCRILDIGGENEKPANEGMEWGNRHEPAIIQKFMEGRPGLVAWNPCPGGYEHPMQHRPSDILPELKAPQAILCGTPDRIETNGVSDPEGWLRVLEVKTAHYRSAHYWGPSGTDEIPEYYLPQVLWYQMLCGLPVADVAVLIGGSHYREYEIPFDPELGGMMLEAAKKFWADHIVPRIPPLEVGAADGQALARVFPKHKSDDLATSTPEIDEIAARLRDNLASAKTLDNRVAEDSNAFKAIIGDHAGIRGDWGRITWKARKDTDVLDKDALVQELCQKPAGAVLVAKHTHRKPGARVFLANFKEEE